MKKYKQYYIYLILSLFLLSFTDGIKKKTDWEIDHLNGKVKSVHVFYFNKADEKTLAVNPLTILKTDTSNHLIINYDADGNVSSHVMSNGRRVFISNFDTAHYMVVSTKFAADGRVSYEDTSLYDENGYRVETMEHIYVNDTLYYRASYNVDRKGNPLEMDATENNKFLFKWKYNYDESGNKIEEDQYYLYDSLMQKWVYQYDPDRNVIEKAKYTDSLLEKFDYKYDGHHNVIEELRYDSNSKLVEDITYKYEYDDKGNWMRKVTSGSKHDYPVTIRFIEYY